MSAIAGIYQLDNEPIPQEDMEKVMGNLSQFPANDIQLWKKDYVFLGCHAQWITPESVGEQLPFYDSETEVAITADAMIDNREDLFERLQIKHSDRRTIPDSQLILLGYYKWGEEVPNYLVGDFAFMIWDKRKEVLFGATDPSGYRTLYYFKSSSKFAFCTTIEPLLELSYIRKKLNTNWMAEFLAITGVTDSVDAQMTPYSGINQVPPFHSVTICNNQLKLKKYGLFFTEEKIRLKSDNEYVEMFQELFQEAVTCRLRTNRPVGSYLSGGLDSGSVVGFAARELVKSNKTLHTFSYIPPTDFTDFTPRHLIPNETPYIKKTVQNLKGIDDHYYSFDDRNTYLEVDEILKTMEMPYKFLQNSFWLKGVFEKAEEHNVGILLNGDKGNFTISWGSAMSYYSILLKRLRWIKLYQELNQYSRNANGPRLGLLKYITKLSYPTFYQLLQANNTPTSPHLINPEFAKSSGVFAKLKKFGIGDNGWLSEHVEDDRKIVYRDMVPWNSPHTLDCKLSLRYSLWKRDPTNDIRIIRFCLSIPNDQFVKNGLDRSLIRRSTADVLPDEVRLNQTVRGVQAADWVHRMKPNWKDFITELKQLSKEPSVKEMIDESVLHQAIQLGEQGPRQEFYNHPAYSVLLRSLVVGRFLKKF